ncbi:hypothetical protein C0995_000655 [Termitomyces sp. Mi166|nr:hypothetical protein C0995_000655 [Termitomyces sp. Mi166\
MTTKPQLYEKPRVPPIHIRAILQKLVESETDPDKEVEKMIEFLKQSPPTPTLLEFGASDDGLAMTVTLRHRIFICRDLSLALEQIEHNTLIETQLKYLVFNALLHEMSHWLHFDPQLRQTSGHELQYQGHLWGGIIDYAFPVEGLNGFYKKPDGNTKRAFKKIALVVRRSGDYKDTKREHIPLEAMVKRLTPGTIITSFADDELAPMFVIHRHAKDVWSEKDPMPKIDPEDEGKRRNDVDIVFATEEAFEQG